LLTAPVKSGTKAGERPVLHTIFIAFHAVAGVVCFAAGALSLALRAPRSARFRLYLGSLLALLLFVAAAIGVDWAGLGLAARLTYLGLLGLGLYMLWRAVNAGTRLRRQGRGWRSGYVDDIGFTLISLFDGFVIVSAIDLHAPIWLVLVIAVGGVVAGIQAMKRVKTRLGT
jgi:hypothetical protein